MTILLVRHGETPGNATRVVQPADTPLNDVGLEQAALIAERIAELGAARIVTSPLPRARMTAEPIAQRLHLTVELEPLLEERNFGDLRGIAYKDLPGGNPFGPDVAPKNGETWAVFYERMARAWERIEAHARATTGNLVIVTHGLVVSSILSRHVPLADGLVVPGGMLNGSISVLEQAPPYTARVINDVSHLGSHLSKTNYGAA